jgi:mono/diheme cytochrome c family protein
MNTPRTIRSVAALAVLMVIVSTAAVRGAHGAADARRGGSARQTAEQVKRGEATYLDECSRCHAETLTGTESGPALAGDAFVRAWAGKTVGDLFVRVRDTMPADSPRRIPAQRSADVVAYLLRENRLNAGDDALSADVAALSRIVISVPDLVAASSRTRP